MKTPSFNLNYSFSSKVSPHIDLVEKQQQLWIENYLWMPQPMREAYKTSKIITLAAMIFPNADYNGLLSIARWILLGFAFDDYYDPSSEEEFSIICQKSIDVLNGTEVDQNSDTVDDIFLREFASVRDMFKEVASPFWVKRFIANQELWLEGMKEETAYNHYTDKIVYPTYANYLSIREKISGCLILSDFIEVASGFMIPEEIYNTAYIQKLRHHITFSIMWCNDIYGAEREFQRNEVMNLVLVLKNEHNCSLEEAYEMAEKLHNDGMAEFIKLSQNIPDFGEYNDDLKNYIENAKLLLQGQQEWHENSNRYKKEEA